MTEQSESNVAKIVVQSARFGEFTVAADSVIEVPSGVIGFPSDTRFVLLEHKAPFSWLHSIDNPALAFVVVDGGEFGADYQFKPPFGDKNCDLSEQDEFAVLVIVTVRPDPTLTTANLKAPLVINLRNRKGVQLVLDDQRYSTRHLIWSKEEAAKKAAEEKKDEKKEPTK